MGLEIPADNSRWIEVPGVFSRCPGREHHIYLSVRQRCYPLDAAPWKMENLEDLRSVFFRGKNDITSTKTNLGGWKLETHCVIFVGLWRCLVDFWEVMFFSCLENQQYQQHSMNLIDNRRNIFSYCI